MAKTTVALMSLVGVMFCVTRGPCLADTAALLEQAEEYERTGNYAQAEDTYKQVLAEKADSDDGMRAQERLTMLYIGWGRKSEAEAAYQKLVAEHSTRAGIAAAVDHVADKYRNSGDYQKALGAYQFVVTTWPSDEHALDSYGRMACIGIRLGEEASVQAAVDKLIADYSEREDVADVLSEIANEYRKSGSSEQIAQLYQRVASGWPAEQRGICAQAAVARVSAASDDAAAAQAEVNRLISRFTDSEELKKAVDQVADEHRKAGRYDKALPLYQYVVDHWPRSERAMEALKGVAISNIGLGNNAAAEAAADKLIADFNNNELETSEDLSETLYQIAKAYEAVESYEQARALYGWIIAHRGESSYAEIALFDVEALNIFSLSEAVEEAELGARVDSLIAAFAGHEGLRAALYRIGVHYHLKANKLRDSGSADEAAACFGKAAVVFEKVVNEFPAFFDGGEACVSAGACRYATGQYQESMQWCRKVLADHPDCRYAGYALFILGRSHEKLKGTDAIGSAEADAESKLAYEQLLARYPDCRWAAYARSWLDVYARRTAAEED